MRDESDGRAWAEHHHQFSQWVADAVRQASKMRIPAQLFAAFLAVSVAAIGLGLPVSP